jgi:hypothetical protein
VKLHPEARRARFRLGLGSFGQVLERLGVPVVLVQWFPPVGGDAKKAALLTALADEDEEA